MTVWHCLTTDTRALPSGTQQRRTTHMGLMRKMTSMSTLGIVNYRSSDERSKRYAKQTRNAARAQVAQNAMALELQRQQLAALDHGNVREEVRDITAPAPMPTPATVGAPPAGWYLDP